MEFYSLSATLKKHARFLSDGHAIDVLAATISGWDEKRLLREWVYRVW
jgi:hypothetical protein